MPGALAVLDDVPDLLGTAPSDLIPTTDEFADVVTARRRAERIRAHLVSYTHMRQDIADAFAFRDWAALGYSSWYDYLTGEFGPELQQLSRNRSERQEAARDLRARGLSTRQIASVTGVDAKTVRNDLATQDGWCCQACYHMWPIVPGESNECPSCGGRGAFAPAVTAPETVTGKDGKTYPARRQPPPAPATDTPAAGPAGDESPAGPIAPAIPVADAALHADRPGAPSGSPAGRDLRGETDSGEAGSAAVATPGQPGPDIAQRRSRIAFNVEQLANVVSALCGLAAEATAADVPLFALRQQRDDLDRLIRRLEHTTATEVS